MAQIFAAFALIVGVVSCAGHMSFWLLVKHLADIALPLEQRAITVPIANRAVAFCDLFVRALEVSLLTKVAVAGLLVVVSWGLWFRCWWARRVALIWCALVAFTFVLDFVELLHIEAAIASTEMGALRDLISMASARVGTGTSATYASMVDWGASMAVPWVRDHLLYASNIQLSDMLDTGLIYYLLLVAWFPSFCLVAFIRPSARRYFVSRPST